MANPGGKQSLRYAVDKDCFIPEAADIKFSNPLATFERQRHFGPSNQATRDFLTPLVTGVTRCVT